MNQRFNKTFVITKEMGSNGAILTNSKVFKSLTRALDHKDKFFRERIKGTKRHVEVYEIKHILTQTRGMVSKKKAVVVEKKV
jgi:hypothetical protein